MIRSICEYCSVIWNPHYKVYINKVERIQRKFTRLIYYKLKMHKTDYPTRLSALHMFSLSDRRYYFDEVCLFKMINGYVNSDLIEKLSFSTSPYSTRNNPTFRLPKFRTNVIFKCPSFRLQYSHNIYFNDINLTNPMSPETFKSLILSRLPIAI